MHIAQGGNTLFDFFMQQIKDKFNFVFLLPWKLCRSRTAKQTCRFFGTELLKKYSYLIGSNVSVFKIRKKMLYLILMHTTVI